MRQLSEKTLTFLKQFNINCVRTSHYPPVIRYLELADEYGIYIIDETGDEAHATRICFRRQKNGKQCTVKEPEKWFCATGTIRLYFSGVPVTKVVKVIISVLLLMKARSMTKRVTGCMAEMHFSHHCEDIIGPRYPQLYELIT